MKINLALLGGLGLLAWPSVSLAQLSVSEGTDGLSVRRDGQELISSLTVDCGMTMSGDIKSSFVKTADGSRVWNRWSDDPDRRFRLEVAERADGAIEITMMGEVDVGSPSKRRMLRLDLPERALMGKPYRRVSRECSSAFRTYGEEEGTFTSPMKTFFTRFLATDGLTFDFNPLGAGDESGAILWSDAGNQLNNNGVGGYWMVERRENGYRFSCGGDIPAAWGGFAGGKLVIREGKFSDFSELHAIRTFHYPLRLEPTRLVSLGAPVRGEKYADGNFDFDPSRHCGWLKREGAEPRRTVIGYREGAYYSGVAGKGRATYRFDGLVKGWHIVSFAAGNFTGVANRFSVKVNGETLLDGISVDRGRLRRVSKAVHLADGRLDLEFDGDWLVSAIGDQALINDGEDFSVARAFWVTDGYEPCSIFRNVDYRMPFVPKLRDETDVLPVPKTEASAPRRPVPMPVERPSVDLPGLKWAKTAKMERLLGNSVPMTEFDRRPGSLERYADRQLLSNGVGVVMLSGMHSRHTYLNHIDRGIESIRRICEGLHKRGIKVIDHHDSTLLWNFPAGFRVMMERLDETAITRDAGLPSWQFCPSNRKWTKTYFAYLRKLVEAGVDGLQIDELTYWSLGCRCHDCREAFRRDTGWELPLNECDAEFNNPESQLRRVWHDWRKKAVTNWFVALRRYLKDLREDFILSSYTTNDAFCCPNWARYVSDDAQDLGRVMNYFGSEMMSRSALRDGRNLLAMLNLRTGLAPTGVPPLWIWWYNCDYANEYFAWGLSALVGQTPLLSAMPIPRDGVRFEDFGKGPLAFNRDGATSAAEVAILFPTYTRDFGSNWQQRRFRREMFGTAQTLDTLHIPYRFISDAILESGKLDGFKALLVGDADCLSAAEIASVKAFAERGGKVRMTAQAGTADDFGAPRTRPVFGPHPNLIVTETARGVPFEQWETWNTGKWSFDPDPQAVAAFQQELLDWCGQARSWKIEAPAQVYSSVWREKSGACVVQLLNGTGVKMKVGEQVLSEAPDPAFPPIDSDIVITAPATAGDRAVAASPDFPKAIELAVRKNADGSRTVILPKELFKVYALVRFSGKAEELHPAWASALEPPAAYAGFVRKITKLTAHDCGDFTVEVYRQANGPDTNQRVMLALPKNLKTPAPAVVVPFYFPEAMLGRDPATGETASPYASPNTNLTYYAAVAFMRDLVRRGYIAVSADAFYLTYRFPEEAADSAPDAKARSRESFAAWKRTAEAFARDWPDWTGIGKLTFDTRLLVDLLTADVRVDAGRIGMMGHSLGGKMAFYAGMLDPRVKVVVASDFGLGWTQTNWEAPWYWGARLNTMRQLGLSQADLLSASGAKPFCLIAGEADDADSGAIMRSARGYEHCPERLLIIRHGTGHRPPRSALTDAYRFLASYL